MQPEKRCAGGVGDLHAAKGNAVGDRHPNAGRQMGGHLQHTIRGRRRPALQRQARHRRGRPQSRHIERCLWLSRRPQRQRTRLGLARCAARDARGHNPPPPTWCMALRISETGPTPPKARSPYPADGARLVQKIFQIKPLLWHSFVKLHPVCRRRVINVNVRLAGQRHVCQRCPTT